MKNHQLLFIFLSLGLAIRIIFISLPGFQADVITWFAWSQRLSEIPISSFYSDKVFSDYLPGFLYVLKTLGLLKSIFEIQASTFYEILKLPAILADLGIGILIYLILNRKKLGRLALWASAFFLLNPATIFNSAIWGQADGFLTLFLLSAIYFLETKYLILSSIFFSLSFLIKPQAVSIAPIFLLYLIRYFSIINFTKIVLPGFITTFILSVPFFLNNPIFGLLQKILQTASEYPYTSLNAYNLWGAVSSFWTFDIITWNNLSYQVWGYTLLCGYWIIITCFYLKGKLSLYTMAALATLAFFFLPTRVHERYLYPSLVFLIITSFQLKSKALIILTAILSFLHFTNLYFVYIYHNKMQLHFSDALYVQPFYDFAAQNPFILSVLSVIIFIIITILLIRLNYGYQKNSS